MTEAPFDVKKAHRWFAVELNNLTWDLVEAPSRTGEEVERMIHAAHAACYHWLQAGTLLNHLRAQCLLATAYAVANLPDGAVRHAARCLELSTTAGTEQTLFDRACAYGCAANAQRCAGNAVKAAEFYELALQAAAQFEDADERQVFEKLYAPK